MLSERKCSLCELEKREQPESVWIVACGHPECGEILVDETEATPYVAQLEAENARSRDDLKRVLEIAIERGVSLGYEDEDWREWLKTLEGGDDAE